MTSLFREFSLFADESKLGLTFVSVSLSIMGPTGVGKSTVSSFVLGDVYKLNPGASSLTLFMDEI